MKKTSIIFVLLLLSIFLLSNTVWAKKIFEGYWEQTTKASSSVMGAPQQEIEIQKVYYKKDKMKIIDEAEGTIMIFRHDKELMWTIDQNNGTYEEVLYSEVEAGMDEAKKTMAENMKNMDPKQREMIEKMMGSKSKSMFMDGNFRLSFKKTNQTKTINGYKCKKVLMLTNNEPLMEMWMTDKYKLSSEYMKIYEQMGFAKGDLTEVAKQIEGFPIQTNVSMDTGFGKVESITTVNKIVAKSISDNEFNLPRGVKKQKSRMSPFQQFK